MYCISCGEKITSSDAGFCVKCGSRLDESVLRDQENTEELVLRMKSGDRDAFAQLYSENYSSVLFTVRSVVRDEDAATDILQDVFITAYHDINQLEENDHFREWIKDIAQRKARNFAASHNEQTTQNNSADSSSKDVDEALLQKAFDDLPEEQRTVLDLFYRDEMSVAEIAGHLGITEAAVISRLKYGKAKIKRAAKHLY